MNGNNRENKIRIYKKQMYRRILVGFGISLAVCLIITFIMYRFFVFLAQDQFSDKFYGLTERLNNYMEDMSLGDYSERLGFLVAVEAQTDVGITYISVEKEDTGELIADSQRNGYLIDCRNAKETPRIYKISYDLLGELEKYDTLGHQKKMYCLADMNTLEPAYDLEEVYYNFTLESAYIGEDMAFPCEVAVEENDPENTEFLTTTKQVDTIHFEPDTISGMECIDNSEHRLYFLLMGNAEIPQLTQNQMEVISEPLGKNDSSVLYRKDSYFWPGNTSLYGMFRYIDSADESYIVRYSSSMEFAGIKFTVLNVNLIVFLFLMIIFSFRAKRIYRKEKYNYSIRSYQNHLMDVMSHDLRTPLMVMSGYAENLREEANEDKREYYIDAILKNTGYMNRIIARNLELSGIEDKDIKKNYTQLEIVSMLEEALKEQQAAFEERKISLRFSGRFEIKGSEPMMKTTMENLVSNLIKYTTDGGEIIVAGEEKTLSIRNTTEESFGNPKLLWEPFVRGDESRSNQNGTGLGLSIIQSILLRHKLKYKLDFREGYFVMIIKK